MPECGSSAAGAVSARPASVMESAASEGSFLMGDQFEGTPSTLKTRNFADGTCPGTATAPGCISWKNPKLQTSKRQKNANDQTETGNGLLKFGIFFGVWDLAFVAFSTRGCRSPTAIPARHCSS